MKRVCPECGFKGNIYDFSPAIKIAPSDFRIFHMYNGMRGALYCNQCKRKHLLKIFHKKKLTEDHKEFLKKEINKFKLKHLSLA